MLAYFSMTEKKWLRLADISDMSMKASRPNANAEVAEKKKPQKNKKSS